VNKNIVHEIGNLLHQIISNTERISTSEEPSVYARKIKEAAYKIDALMTDSTVDKSDVEIHKEEASFVDFSKLIGLNILIVDDVVENIHIMENIFKTLSCNIQSAMSGEEALEVFKNGYVPDIVCMDMIMPGIDGSTTTKELKLLGCKAYFIAISALKNQPSSVVSLFDCWLPKPFTQEHIIGALSGYDSMTCEEIPQEEFKLTIDIPLETQEEISILAKKGAYSKLSRLIETLAESDSKEFLKKSLKDINFPSILKSIVSP